MINIEKRDKLTSIIILGLFFSSFAIGYISYLIVYQDDTQGNTIDRILLFSLDSASPEYISPNYMPKLYWLLKSEGVMYKNAWAPIASETMNGHTTMLTGCQSNSTGIIGNGFYCSDLPDDQQAENPVQDPKWRLVNTVFEDISINGYGKTTGFVSGKWRLPAFLANESDYIFASPTNKVYPLCPPGYETIVGTPITYSDGDMTDQWVMRALTALIQRDDPDFVFINLAWVDVSGHDTGSFNENHARELRQVDDMIYQLMVDLKAMGKFDSTLFIFTGDHGMDSIRDIFDPQSYLVENGIDVKKAHGEGQSAFIFLNDKGQTDAAVNLLKANDKVAVVLNRSEMSVIHVDTYENRTGQIYISCKEDIAISMGGLSFSQIGTHGGVSARDVPMAWMGPTIKKGEFIQDKFPGLEDIIPTIYDIWGYTIPNYMDGDVLNEIFE